MGFLFQVLKDVREKQPYSVGKTILKEFVERELKPKLSTGRDGFQFIAQVADRVGEYNVKTMRSNTDVKNKITTLDTQMEQLKKEVSNIFPELNKKSKDSPPPQPTEYTADVANEGVRSIKEKLSQCKQYSQTFRQAIAGVSKSVNDLNHETKEKVEKAKSSIAVEKKRLEQLAENEEKELREMEKQISTTLAELSRQMKSQISCKVENLVERVKEKITAILKKLRDINDKLQQYIKHLQRLMDKIVEWINLALVKVKNIMKQLENPADVGSQKGLLEAHIKEACDELSQRVSELEAWNAAAGRAVSAAKEKCTKIGKMVETGSAGDVAEAVIYNQAKDMSKKAEELRKAAQSVKDGIGGWVTKALTKVKEMDEALKGDLKKVKEAIEAAIRKSVTPHGRCVAVESAIKEVTQTLEEEIGKSDDSKSTVTLTEESEKFEGYKAYVKQDAQALEALASGEVKTAAGENKLPQAIKKIETDVTGKLTAEKLGKEIGASDTFTDPFDKITAELQKIAGLVDSEKQMPKSSDSKTGITNYLDDMSKMLGKDSVDLQSDIKDTHPSVQGLAKIKAEIQKLKTGNVDKLTDKLKELCQTAREAARDIKDILEGVRDGNIGTALVEFKDKLNTEQINMDTAIKDLYRLLESESKKFREECISELHVYVDAQIQKANDALTTQAKKHYVSSIKLAIHHFVSKIQNELKHLPALIDKELKEGYKGFMLAFEGKPEPQVSEDGTQISPPSSNTDQRSKLIEFREAVSKETLDVEKVSTAFRTFYWGLESYVKREIQRVNDERNEKKHPRGTEKQTYTDYFIGVNGEFSNVLTHLKNENRIDHDTPELLDWLDAAINNLVPDGFYKTSTPILDAITCGLRKFQQELQHAYISSYDRQKIHWQAVSEEEKEMYAKIILTIIPILSTGLTELKYGLEYENWDDKKIYNASNPTSSLHVRFFSDNGYDNNLPQNAKHGELNHRDTFNGSHILEHLNNQTHKLFSLIPSLTAGIAESRSNLDGPQIAVEQENGHIRKLHHYLETYFAVRHLTVLSSPRSPCSIYDISVWLCGLPYNPVYGKVKDSIKKLFEAPSEDDPSKKIIKAMDAHPNSFTHEDVNAALDKVTSLGYMLLTGVLGHGDAATYYACDFPANSVALKYPTSGADCLDMLLDVLRRMFPVLTFLLTKCNSSASHGGWRECFYGKNIMSAKWSCTDHSSDQSRCQPNCQANDKANCQPRSPLMSYFNDCLPGHLPHQLINVGCKADCKTCPQRTPGMPCLTPLGFRAFSNSTHTGADLCIVLSTVCGEDGWLTKLFSQLTCLLNRPPQWFPEIFSFCYQLTQSWEWMSNNRKASHPIQKAIATAIEETVACNSVVARKFLDSCRNLSKGSSHSSHDSTDNPDLTYLVGCNEEYCGKYFSPLSLRAYSVFAAKYASSYLSLLLYAASKIKTFVEQLTTAYASISCYDSGCNGCLNNNGCRTSKHGSTACGCRSMVTCRGVASVFYQHGITLTDATYLRRTNCAHFYDEAFKFVNGHRLKSLFYDIDNFMFTIRQPFIWLNVALWLLSLLYLTHIMVIRLDLLHIKSHLHSPSSHRIAAQSLLAASRVNKLNRVFYLQP